MCENNNIEYFVNSLSLDEPVSPEQLAKIVSSAIRDRALIFYFIWKAIQDLHPEIDADEIMAEGSKRFGEYRAPGLAPVKDAADALCRQTSKAGMLAFEQKITKLTPEHSEKIMKHCPFIDTFNELGCTQEEKTKLCTKLLMPGDYGLLSPYKNIRLEFPKNLAEDNVCILCTKLDNGEEC